METGLGNVLQKIRYFFIPYLVILCTGLVIKLFYSRAEIYFTVNRLYYSAGDLLAPYITAIGDGITIVILSALLLLYNCRAAFLLISSYAVSSIIAQVLKYSFDMPRPHIYFENQLSRIHYVKGIYILSVHSFPSGHTVTAFSAGVVIAYLVKNKSWAIAALLVAVLVGYSRMYLSQHFFEDVMAGSVIGVFVTVLWLVFIDRQPFIKTPGWNRGLMRRNL